MDESTRFLVGVISVGALYWIMGGTIIHIIRRRRGYEPPWTWRSAMSAFFLIEFSAGLLLLVPVVGLALGMVAFYGGFKYSTGLGFVRTLFLGLAMLIVILTLTSVVSFLLGVNLNEMWDGLGQRHR